MNIPGAVEAKRLQLEVSILKKLKHVNIMELHDFFEEPYHYVVVTEFMEGGDLLSRLRTRKNYSQKVARDLFVILASAVQYIHDQDVVHRDLKVSKSTTLPRRLIVYPSLIISFLRRRTMITISRSSILGLLCIARKIC